MPVSSQRQSDDDHQYPGKKRPCKKQIEPKQQLQSIHLSVPPDIKWNKIRQCSKKVKNDFLYCHDF